MDGILNIWKPVGMTSHDVVAAVRRMTGQRRVGHAGTLDPLAEGVLVVGIGQGTRVLEYLSIGTKEYCARFHLGVTTETDDAEGAILSVKEVRQFRRPTIERVLSSFVGKQEQMPPVYTALKQDGQAAYRLARAGREVKRTARTIEVEAIQLVAWHRPHVVCRITCSKGTYVRSLARDVGERLGCGAYLCGLVRLRSGTFTLDDAVPLSLLEHALTVGYVDQLLWPLDEALIDRPAVVLGRSQETDVRHGKEICLGSGGPYAEHECRWRAYSSDGTLVAVLVPGAQPGWWRADKVFADASQAYGNLGTATAARCDESALLPPLQR